MAVTTTTWKAAVTGVITATGNITSITKGFLIIPISKPRVIIDFDWSASRPQDLPVAWRISAGSEAGFP